MSQYDPGPHILLTGPHIVLSDPHLIKSLSALGLCSDSQATAPAVTLAGYDTLPANDQVDFYASANIYIYKHLHLQTFTFTNIYIYKYLHLQIFFIYKHLQQHPARQ